MDNLMPSAGAKACLKRLDDKVAAHLSDVRACRAYRICVDPGEDVALARAVVRESYRAVTWYRPENTAAAFHMLARFPVSEARLMVRLVEQKADKAERVQWAREGLEFLQGAPTDDEPPSAAANAAIAVWWRIAHVEHPMSFLGIEFLYAHMILILGELLAGLKQKGVAAKEVRYIAEQSVERSKYACFLADTILYCATKYPECIEPMLRAFDYLAQVYPVPVWAEALTRAQANTKRLVLVR